MGILNRDTEAQSMDKSSVVRNMSTEQLKQLVAMKNQQSQPSFGSRVGESVRGAGDIFMQMGGLKPPQTASAGSSLQDQIALALFKSQLEQQQQKALVESLGLGGEVEGGFRPKAVTSGGITYERTPTEAERQRETRQKAEEQAAVASEKERQVNISKIKRLGTMADVIEKSWTETMPGKGGIGRVSGLASIPMSTLQMNEQQQIDSAYRTFVKGMRAQLARAMGDVGNLSEPEQKAAMALVPGLGDNYETGMRKIQTIRRFVEAIQSGNVGGARETLLSASSSGIIDKSVAASDLDTLKEKYGLD